MLTRHTLSNVFTAGHLTIPPLVLHHRYNLLDKILLKTPPGRRIAAAAEAAGKAPSLTGGLVEDASTTVLPAVRPGHTLILVLLAILPSLIALWRRPHPRAFVHTIVACSMGSFMLGWHVRGNEKERRSFVRSGVLMGAAI